jgi:hypothetical protein
LTLKFSPFLALIVFSSPLPLGEVAPGFPGTARQGKCDGAGEGKKDFLQIKMILTLSLSKWEKEQNWS